MSEKLYSYKEFLNGLKQRKIPVYNDLTKKLPEMLENIINQDEEVIFYGKNIYNQTEKDLYFFLFTKIIHVQVQERDVTFRSMKRNIIEAEYVPGFYPSDPTKLTLTFKNGESLVFNSLEDSDVNWNPTYAEMLLTIYKSI